MLAGAAGTVRLRPPATANWANLSGPASTLLELLQDLI